MTQLYSLLLCLVAKFFHFCTWMIFPLIETIRVVLTVFIKNHLAMLFEMKDLGPLCYFLIIEVVSSTHDYTLSQTKYALDILNRAGLTDEKTVATSKYNVKLSQNDATLLNNPTQ